MYIYVKIPQSKFDIFSIHPKLNSFLNFNLLLLELPFLEKKKE